MFNLFKSKPKTGLNHLVYVNKIAKYRELIKEIQTQLSKGKPVYLLAHFKKTISELNQLLTSAGTPYELGLDTLSSNQVYLLTLEELIKDRRTISDNASVILSEMYPLSSATEPINKIYPYPIKVYCALDNPFFVLFGGDKMTGVLEKLGLKEDEPVQHHLVTKAILTAKKKMDEKIPQEVQADSIEEWISANDVKPIVT